MPGELSLIQILEHESPKDPISSEIVILTGVNDPISYARIACQSLIEEGFAAHYDTELAVLFEQDQKYMESLGRLGRLLSVNNCVIFICPGETDPSELITALELKTKVRPSNGGQRLHSLILLERESIHASVTVYSFDQLQRPRG